MIIINEEQYQTRTPCDNYNEFLNLNKEEKEKYLYRLSKYYSLFIQYLINKIGLDTIDKDVGKVESDFKKVEKEEMDLYQYIASEYLDYLYVRNNVYIERLTKEGLDFLDNASETLNGESAKFIEATYPILICEKLEGPESHINYGPAVSSYFLARTDNLVLGVRVGSPINSVSKMSAISFLKRFIVSKAESNILIPIDLKCYDENSIIKLSDSKSRNV